MTSTIFFEKRNTNKTLEFDMGITGVQSPWIIDAYKQYFGDKRDGFLVEIGVGGTVDWRSMGLTWTSKDICNFDWDKVDSVITCGNHTIELIMQGWTGIYIESLSEFIDYELEPLFRKTLDEEHFNKIKLVKCGASDKKKTVKISHNESLVNCYGETGDDKIIPYEYHLHGGRKLECENTSVLLEQNECPSNIDLMVIDVEGFEEYVLMGLDFSKYKPKMMFIEVGITQVSAIQKLIPEDYIVIANDGLNALFVLKEFYKGPINSPQNH